MSLSVLRLPLRAMFVAAPLALIAACSGASSEGSTANPAPGETPAAAETAKADDMYLGAADAPVTIIEYASVTCPACASFHANFFPAIKADYIDAGKVKFVFREFPTAPAEFSVIGSVLARCAAEKSGKDAYFLVVDNLFRTQRAWIYGEDPKLELLKIASQVGMDETAFDACIRRQDLVDVVNANTEGGREEFQVNSTPTFILEGEKMAFRSADEFRAAVDKALAAKGVEAPAAPADATPAEDAAPAPGE